MERKVLGLTDIEDLSWLASELVYGLYMEGMQLDREGNYLDYDEKRAVDFIKRASVENPQFKYLNMRKCEELKALSLSDVVELSVKDIKEKY